VALLFHSDQPQSYPANTFLLHLKPGQYYAVHIARMLYNQLLQGN